jgi:hypothetical protein
VQTLIWCRSSKFSWQCVFRHDLSDHDSVWSVDTNTGRTLPYKWCVTAPPSLGVKWVGWCHLVGHAAPKVHITDCHSESWELGRRYVVSSVSCPIPTGTGHPLPPSPLTGIFLYYPYIHLEGMRKSTKSLNITCKQAVLLQTFSPVLHLPARLCEHKILVYRHNVSNHLLQ